MLYKQRLGAEIALRPPGCFCESKLIYVVSLATDADTGDKTVIWTTSPLRMPSSTMPEKSLSVPLWKRTESGGAYVQRHHAEHILSWH